MLDPIQVLGRVDLAGRMNLILDIVAAVAAVTPAASPAVLGAVAARQGRQEQAPPNGLRHGSPHAPARSGPGMCTSANRRANPATRTMSGAAQPHQRPGS